MPSIDISHRDLNRLVGKTITLEELKEKAVLYAKSEVDGVSGDIINLDIKDTNRPDLWSVEGVAREIAGRYGRHGLPEYSVSKSGVRVNVDPKTSKVRPMIACAVVRGLDIDENVLSQMIQLQEKVAGTFGRNRKEVAIGVYDMSKITPPITYKTVRPDSIKFIPLEMDRELTPAQILEQHPKGKEFRHLLEGHAEYPVLVDSAGEVLSMPPIINSNHTGKVTEKTRDVFVECTGFEERFLFPALNVLVTAMADRGGRIESVEIVSSKKTVTPDLSPKKSSVNVDFVNSVSGLGLSGNQIVRLLGQARMKATLSGKKIEVLYPAYRQDIMHPVDLVEDVIISYGYNEIGPESPTLATVGGELKKEVVSRMVAQVMVGLGAQEIMSYILTSKDNLFRKMNAPKERIVEIENAMSSNWEVMRNTLLSAALDFLSRNRHVEYPQKIFEIGDAVELDPSAETRTKDVRKLSYAFTDAAAGYENAASDLGALMAALGIKYRLKRTEHPSFIRGRCAGIHVDGKRIGTIGEISPRVLVNWGMETPVAAFEISLSDIQPVC